MSGDATWATVRIRLDSSCEPVGAARTREALAELAGRLDELGALLALEDEVGGVETRDPTTLGSSPERPELWVYTTPTALEAVTARALALGDCMALRLRLDTEVRDDEDWHDAWKQYYQPMIIGSGTLLVRPSWVERKAGDPGRELILDPGRAFGTGLHATTRLCLDRICALFDARLTPPSRVLDLGCGSGILGLACARLFPGARIVAADVDAEATATTAENAALNELRIEIVTGTLEDVVGTFDLVLANIRPEVLRPLATTLPTRLATEGRLVLSGILEEEAEAIEADYLRAGFVLDEVAGGGRRSLESWTAFDLHFGQR